MNEIILIMLFTVTPIATDATPDPAPIQGAIEFTWPPKYGDLEACKTFRSGASFWHPPGTFNAIGNCVERQGDGSAEG